MTTETDDSWDAYLGPGEKLLWTGAPERDTRLRWKQIGMAIFGAPFLIVGVGLFTLTLWSMIRGEAEEPWQWGLGLFLMLFAVPFAGAGFFVMFVPHLVGRLAHRYVRYAVGTQRTYIATRWWSRNMTSFAITREAKVELIRDGLDTVVVQTGTKRDSDGDIKPIEARLEGLADGLPVYQLIRQIQSDMADAPRPGD